ncbi:hypothetical protein [Microbispora sitophila]|uniref:hypothetical protein n=1 Tax=Microbispora sitophila TaxID=2771537 RepID=UPI0018668F90|nr:hypothetical protein [Microbispora sitophila]
MPDATDTARRDEAEMVGGCGAAGGSVDASANQVTVPSPTSTFAGQMIDQRHAALVGA